MHSLVMLSVTYVLLRIVVTVFICAWAYSGGQRSLRWLRVFGASGVIIVGGAIVFWFVLVRAFGLAPPVFGKHVLVATAVYATLRLFEWYIALRITRDSRFGNSAWLLGFAVLGTAFGFATDCFLPRLSALLLPAFSETGIVL
jgi:hypothetical protein